MDRHEPQDGYAEVFEVVEFWFDAAEVASRGERTRVDLVNDAGGDPVGNRARGRLFSGGKRQRSGGAGTG